MIASIDLSRCTITIAFLPTYIILRSLTHTHTRTHTYTHTHNHDCIDRALTDDIAECSIEKEELLASLKEKNARSDR